MTLLHTRLWMGGILCCALSLHSAGAVSGCSNLYLQGTYNIQIDNASIINTLSALSASASSTTTPAIVAPSATVTGPGQVEPIFPGSLVDTPYLGRYYFDGNGSVVGMENARDINGNLSPVNTVVGSYSVDDSCNASISLNGGRNFTAVLAGQGQSAVFMETDEAGRGATGTLQRSAPSCANPSSPQSFAFRYTGAAQTTSATFAGVAFQPYSSVGTMNLDGAGNFTMTSTVLTGGALQKSNQSGTYTVGTDCGIHLNFVSTNTAGLTGATTGGYEPPSVFNGLLAGSSANGLLSVQPGNGVNLTGLVIGQ
jgi:hypothetical protein